MFCSRHLTPQEDCCRCQETLASMRPTVFAELAAAELSCGTAVCEGCGRIFCEPLMRCPHCGTPTPRCSAAEADFDDVVTIPAALPFVIEADLIEVDLVAFKPRG